MKKIQILLIEDDETAADLLSNLLEDCNFLVDIVHTTVDGISHIKHNNYSLVLLDLNLPDFDGFELLRSIKNNIALPIIVISAYSETQIIVKAFNENNK